MSAAGLLIFTAVLFAAVAVREAGEAGAGATRLRRRARQLTGTFTAGRLMRWMSELPLLGPGASASRLARAGAAGSKSLEGLAITRLVASAVGFTLAGICAIAVGRFIFPTLFTGFCLGLVAPDLLLEQAARQRRRQVLAVLPDTIDILAVAAAGGRGTRASITDLARGGEGPLAQELSLAMVEIESGRTANEALRSLRQRLASPEVTAVTLVMERSARLGSPLAEELHSQAASLRDCRRRGLAEQAARAAPKIQLVIALVLVPSVLLLIAAGLAANADSFFSAL